jgi:hypothetical protein
MQPASGVVTTVHSNVLSFEVSSDRDGVVSVALLPQKLLIASPDY